MLNKCRNIIKATYKKNALHKKRSFTLRISPVNVTKSPVSCGFSHLLEKSLMENFLCSDVLQKKIPHYPQYMHSGKTCTSVNLMITIRVEEWRRKVQKVFFTRSIDKYGVT